MVLDDGRFVFVRLNLKALPDINVAFVVRGSVLSQVKFAKLYGETVELGAGLILSVGDDFVYRSACP